jgi:4-hydroxy-2-oxoheptanedioate aldolase
MAGPEWAVRALQLAIDRRDNMTGTNPPPDQPEMAPDHTAPSRWTPVPAVRPDDPPAAADLGLRQRVRGDARLLGTFSVIPSTDVIELVALAQFDFVVLDMEHGPYTLESIRAALLAAAVHRLPAVVRVPDRDPSMVAAVLDLGADGVLVPQVGSASDAEAVVAAARFAPVGRRGSNPWVRAARFAGSPQWLADSNDRTLVMVMVEGTAAVHDIDQIVAVTGLDAVFLGPVDLSHALGVPGQPEHPKVLATLAEVADRAAQVGVAVAVFAPEPDRARAWLSQGLQLVACAVDSRMILDGLRRVRQAAAPPTTTA